MALSPALLYTSILVLRTTYMTRGFFRFTMDTDYRVVFPVSLLFPGYTRREEVMHVVEITTGLGSHPAAGNVEMGGVTGVCSAGKQASAKPPRLQLLDLRTIVTFTRRSCLATMHAGQYHGLKWKLESLLRASHLTPRT